jgi:hypothetical protein
MTVSNATAAGGPAAISQPSTITIDRNARKALLAALALRLGNVEDIHKTIGARDRVSLGQARVIFEPLWPILDGLNFWDDDEPVATYTIPATDWLEKLVEDYADQTRRDLESDEKWLSETADQGEAAFSVGSYLHDPDDGRHPNMQRLEWIAKMRGKLEDDADELVGMESIIAALGEGEDR